MTQRLLGPTGGRRRRRFLLGLILVAAFAALFVVAGAQAVHNEGFFELGPTPTAPEANITNILGNATDPGPDWADLFTATGAKADANNNNIPDCEESPGRTCAFIADPSAAAGAKDPTTFSGFGTSNKNTDPVSTEDCASRTPPLIGSDCTPWGWAAGNVPAKDDLTNVYAYQVVPTSGPRANHSIIYGGVEREDPSGDSHIDLEFFQSQVALCTPTPCSSFTGVRTVGDTIISMDFLQGGALGSIEVRRWDGSTYVPVGTETSGQGCFDKNGNPGDDICAFNNGASIDGGPWPNYDNHGHLITTLPQNAFTEMGVDLTAVAGSSPCISTFMAKTRSSASFTAELKDFGGPTTFSICQPSTTLSASAGVTIHSGESTVLSFSETNDGNEALLNVSVSADNGCSPSYSSGDTNLNNKLDVGETWVFTCTVSPTSTTTYTATGTGTGELSGKTITFCTDPTNPPSGVTCDQDERAQVTVTVIHPSTSLRKTAQVTITYTYRETNTGDDPLTGVSVADDHCTPVTYASGDANNNGKLDPGETWLFHCTTSTSDGQDLDVTNTGTGHGTDSLGGTNLGPDETDSVRVTVTHNPPS
jgi:hypothetical protein